MSLASSEVTAEKLARFLGLHGEGDAWDFKLTFDLADKRMCAELARDVSTNSASTRSTAWEASSASRSERLA